MTWAVSNTNKAIESAIGASNAVINSPGTAQSQLATAVSTPGITNRPSWANVGVLKDNWTPMGLLQIYNQCLAYDKSYRI